MAFIRIKKINGQEYVYLIRNKWTRQGSRQKLSKYLGKLYVPTLDKPDLKFEDFSDINFEKSLSRDIVRELVKWELARHGFQAVKKNLMVKDNCYANLATRDLYLETGRGRSKAAIKLYNDFLAEYTLRKLLDFKTEKIGMEIVGQEFARAFVIAGINVPKETFITIFQKIYNDGATTKI